MNPLIQYKKTIIRPLLVVLALACLALPPASRALLPPPPPDGGYPGFNTAEGTFAPSIGQLGPSTRPLVTSRCLKTRAAAATRRLVLLRSLATRPAKTIRRAALKRS